MSAARYVLIAAASLALFLLLFDVTVRWEFSLPHDVTRPDPALEAEFSACFEKRDAEIHERAFSRIDNPDVQREFISMQRDAAEQACRERFPRREVTTRVPFRFNLFDTRFRWRD